jgi:hypothetical protein
VKNELGLRNVGLFLQEKVWLRLFSSQTFSRINTPTFSNIVILHIYPPMKLEQTECSETLAYKIHTPGNHPEESIQHSEHGESLKSRIGIILTRNQKLCFPRVSLA